MDQGPYMVLYCDNVPECKQRRFTIGGRVAIWLRNIREGWIQVESIMAFHNLGLGANVGVKADIGADLQESRFLKLQILRALAAKQFPFATYVSHTGTRTIVECRQCDAGAYRALLSLLPRGIMDTDLQLVFNNGVSHLALREVEETTLNIEAALLLRADEWR